MTKTYKTAIHWFRRDLRITDNSALSAAARRSETVVPLYVLSTWKGSHSWTGPGRQAFLAGCLRSLAENLNTLGNALVFRRGPAPEALRTLIRETEAEAVFFNRDPDPFGIAQENEIRRICAELGIACHPCKDVVLHEGDEVLTAEGNPYRVYTPYSRAWFDQPKPEPQGRLRRLPGLAGIDSLAPPTIAHWGLPPGAMPGHLPEPGEKAARSRMRAALSGPVRRYALDRNTPAGVTTSRLGPDLRFGTISIRELYHRSEGLRQAAGSASEKKSCRVFQQELAWREFYMQILRHYPEVLETDFNPQYRELEWDENARFLKRWKEGETGFPIVDAGMRQLRATGFMHNRVRMITAMFLTKDLHIHWREGERHFLQHLLDGEIASNNGGWQWSAGTGADAAPYFRIQNPWTQTRTHDPEGAYIREWVPELRDIPARALWTEPEEGSRVSPGYPGPMVRHGEERLKTLERFKRYRAARRE